MARTVAIGKQDFKELIINDCFYVDKTSFIKEWWEAMDDVTLITRPRRFGKTLTMSMLNYFFSVQHKSDSNLFEGLSIWKEEKYQKLQGTYPVIFLSFADIKADNFEEARSDICALIEDLYNDNSFLVKEGFLEDNEKAAFNNISSEVNNTTAKFSIKRLSGYLSRYYGKKVLIFLDEYDTPMQEAYVNGYWDELVDFTRGLFNATFKTNPYLKRAIMTGITRVSKESIFSDLNNLKVITTRSEKYMTTFGFTEEEVRQALAEYGLADRMSEVKRWYDGFRFGNIDNIYNPWSVVNFLGERVFDKYWANTSSNRLVSDLIRNGDIGVKNTMESLLQGETIKTSFDEEIVFDQLDGNDSENAIWSLLVASGYLKIVDHTLDDDGDTEYFLKITNHEVMAMFKKMVKAWFGGKMQSINTFCTALLSGNTTGMQEYLNGIMQHTISYYDTPTENSYHMFVLGLVACLQSDYVVTSNIESGNGRYDTMIVPKAGNRDAIILEYKKFEEKAGLTLQDSVKDALHQIIEKNYAASLKERGFTKNRVRIYGLVFKGKEVTVGGGYLSEFESFSTESEKSTSRGAKKLSVF